MLHHKTAINSTISRQQNLVFHLSEMGNRRNRRQVILKKTFGIQNERSIEVRASNNKSPESENDDISLRASKMKDLRHPAKSLYQNELNVQDKTIASEEDYHRWSRGHVEDFDKLWRIGC